MKKLLLTLCLLLLFCGNVFATEIVYPFNLTPSGYESITIADTAIGFTSAKLGGQVGGVFCTLETAQVRFTLDGTTPTSSVGHLLEVGQSFTIINRDALSKVRFIRTGDTSGVLKTTYLTSSALTNQ